jgi:hypothetical protein
MTVNDLIKLLETNNNSHMHIKLPSGAFVPAHFHVTEVGGVQKTFIDCGGTRRDEVFCVLQVWTAHDVEHRLVTGKLLNILNVANDVLATNNMKLMIEYGEDVASLYFLSDVEITPSGFLLVLVGKQTDCLAPDKCGINSCKSSNCC